VQTETHRAVIRHAILDHPVGAASPLFGWLEAGVTVPRNVRRARGSATLSRIAVWRRGLGVVNPSLVERYD
jgi:hypothetical protein